MFCGGIVFISVRHRCVVPPRHARGIGTAGRVRRASGAVVPQHALHVGRRCIDRGTRCRHRPAHGLRSCTGRFAGTACALRHDGRTAAQCRRSCREQPLRATRPLLVAVAQSSSGMDLRLRRVSDGCRAPALPVRATLYRHSSGRDHTDPQPHPLVVGGRVRGDRARGGRCGWLQCEAASGALVSQARLPW